MAARNGKPSQRWHRQPARSGRQSFRPGPERLEDRALPSVMLVKDIDPGTGSSDPAHLVTMGGKLFFAANSDAGGTELWVSDGTPDGTRQLPDIREGRFGSAPRDLTVVGETLFFTADDDVHGRELWKYYKERPDGTEIVKIVEDLTTGRSNSTLSDLTAVGRTLFFWFGNELWKSDSISGETRPVEVTERPAVTIRKPQLTTSMTSFQGKLFFNATDDEHGEELWMSDPISGNTKMVADIWEKHNSSGPRNLTVVGSQLFFSANDGTVSKHARELWRSVWKSDGTEDKVETALVADIAPQWTYSSNPENLTNVNGTLFFSANDEVNNRELWMSDGSERGTVPVKDINPGDSNPSHPEHLTVVDGTLFFTADDGVNGIELWKSDGTEAGTVPVANIRPGDDSSSPDELTAVGRRTLFFTANDGENGRELWRSDETGTVRITERITDFQPRRFGASPSFLTALNGALYFVADDEPYGRELWKVSVDASTPNTPPTADAGGPYTVAEGSSLQLDGSGSSDPDPPDVPLTYEWDLDYDGTSFDVDTTGVRPTVSFLDNFPTRTVALRVRDQGGLTHLATTTITVRNAPPVVNAGIPTSISLGEPFTRFGTFADPGADTWEATVDYGDGSGVQPLALNEEKTFRLVHVYANPGTYAVTVTVTDKDGDSGFWPFDVLVIAPPPPPGSLQFSVQISPVAENGQVAIITVNRTGGSAGDVTVAYTIEGTATRGVDYRPVSDLDVLTFPDGAPFRHIVINILDDRVFEGDESFSLSLTNPTGGASLGNPSRATVTIVDDDPQPPPVVDPPPPVVGPPPPVVDPPPPVVDPPPPVVDPPPPVVGPPPPVVGPPPPVVGPPPPVTPPPLVTPQGIIVHTGGSVRRPINGLTVLFSGPVTVEPIAFLLQNTTTSRSRPVGLIATSSTRTPDGMTAVTLSFATRPLSLAEGTYSLTILGDKIVDGLGRPLDGDADGVEGGIRVERVTSLQFGDGDGDGDGDGRVDRRDLRRFPRAYGRRSGQAGFQPSFDFNGNGVIGFGDLVRFLRRLRSSAIARRR